MYYLYFTKNLDPIRIFNFQNIIDIKRKASNWFFEISGISGYWWINAFDIFKVYIIKVNYKN